MKSLHRVLRNFKMPGYTVPEFRRKAVIIAVGGVYDPRIHLDDVVMPVLKKWRIFERDDFTGEAAEHARRPRRCSSRSSKTPARSSR